jgi:hypothetical protein
MLRLVLGLGTRAVNRVESDYPRIVALDKPLSKPLDGAEDAKRFSQHYVDLLETEENKFETVSFEALLDQKTDLSLELVAVRDDETSEKLRKIKAKNQDAWVINFDKLMKETAFPAQMKRMLKTLESAYQYPVDIEFTVNFSADELIHINLLQCRPVPTKGLGKEVSIPKNIPGNKILFSSRGNFVGGNVSQKIQRVIYIDPKGYYNLNEQEKYMAARLVGRLNKMIKNKKERSILLMGPGRWGTSTPSLGIPVSFSEINNVSVLCELEFREGNLSPDISYGSHFFHDLVEEEIFYIALFSERADVVLNKEIFSALENKFSALLPGNPGFDGIINVYDVDNRLTVASDVVSQKAVGYLI